MPSAVGHVVKVHAIDRANEGGAKRIAAQAEIFLISSFWRWATKVALTVRMSRSISWKPSMRFIDLCGVVGDITQVLLEVFTDLASLMLTVLTVTALAQGLKVSPSALYNHVRSSRMYWCSFRTTS